MGSRTYDNGRISDIFWTNSQYVLPFTSDENVCHKFYRRILIISERPLRINKTGSGSTEELMIITVA